MCACRLFYKIGGNYVRVNEGGRYAFIAIILEIKAYG